MEKLKELVKIVNKQKVSKVEVLDNSRKRSNLLNQLYDGIIDEKFETDEEAEFFLYGTKNGTINYKRLKYRLEERLLNTIFFIDISNPNFNKLQKAYYSSYKAQAAISILLGRGGRKYAIPLAEKILKKSIDFEFTEVSLFLLKKITKHYGTLDINPKKFAFYDSLLEKYLHIFNAETLAEKYFSSLNVINDRSREEQISQVNQYCEKLKKYLLDVNSNNFLIFAYSVLIYPLELRNDYKNGINECKMVIQKFEKKQHQHKTGIYMFYAKMVTFYIQTKRYNEAEKIIIKTLEYTQKGKISWFNTYEQYLRMTLYQQEYQKAYEIFVGVITEYDFKSVYENTVEYWRIHDAYFNFLIGRDLVKPIEGIKKFRVAKFLNEVPIFSNDKRGFNIPILVIQLLFLLHQKKFGKVIDKAESLNAYCYRHLKKDNTFRSNCFIRLLLLLPKCNYNRKAVERKSVSLTTKLKSVPIEIATQPVELEIIPYEDLWEIVLNMLDNKFHYPKK